MATYEQQGRLMGCVGQTRAFGCIREQTTLQTSSCRACLFFASLCGRNPLRVVCVLWAGGGNWLVGTLRPGRRRLRERPTQTPERHRNMWWNTHEQIGLNFTQGSMFSMPSLDTPLPAICWLLRAYIRAVFKNPSHARVLRLRPTTETLALRVFPDPSISYDH